MKKLINHPDRVAAEALEGLAAAHPHLLRKLDGLQVVVRADAPRQGKVAVLTGGGSGHEPMFAGFVGPGWADASVAGNIFTSPPPQPIVRAARAVHGGAGVLFLYGNYSGDLLNFDLAAELLDGEGIQVETVRVADDVASAPPDRREERRGIAGDLFVIKAACARAEAGGTLAEVAAAARKAEENTRSMSVALSSCIIPAAGRPIFEIGDDELEIGMGLHGEPGVARSKMQSADEIAGQLLRRILDDAPIAKGSEVAILVNGMGATPLAELYIVFREVHRLLGEAGIGICRSYVGNYASSLDMAGCSLTLLRLDPELRSLLLAPCESPALVQRG
jgi:phosphoenolpyruvate---glycerone phosphotransferase subunit DhaK